MSVSTVLSKAPAWRRYPVLWAAAVFVVLSSAYWLLVASDRYVSEARVVLARSDLSSGQVMDFASLIGGATGANRPDQLQLRDHLRSIDMLKKLDAQLQLRQHSGVVNIEAPFAVQFVGHALLDQPPPKALAVELRLALRRGFLPAQVHPGLSVLFESRPHNPNIASISERAIFDRVGRKFMDRECDNLGRVRRQGDGWPVQMILMRLGGVDQQFLTHQLGQIDIAAG